MRRFVSSSLAGLRVSAAQYRSEMASPGPPRLAAHGHHLRALMSMRTTGVAGGKAANGSCPAAKSRKISCH